MKGLGLAIKSQDFGLPVERAEHECHAIVLGKVGSRFITAASYISPNQSIGFYNAKGIPAFGGHVYGAIVCCGTDKK